MEDRETNSWEMENKRTETTEREVSGRKQPNEDSSTTGISTTTTRISSEEDSEKPREEDQQEMNSEENWHRSEKSPTQLRMTDFEAQSEAARQLKWNTYGRRTSKESLIQDPEIVNDTPVAVTNNKKHKRRNKMKTRFGNPIPW